MDRYVGIIYWSDGSKQEVSHWSGANADVQCERETYGFFQERSKHFANYSIKPTRYEVKKVN